MSILSKIKTFLQKPTKGVDQAPLPDRKGKAQGPCLPDGRHFLKPTKRQLVFLVGLVLLVVVGSLVVVEPVWALSSETVKKAALLALPGQTPGSVEVLSGTAGTVGDWIAMILSYIAYGLALAIGKILSWLFSIIDAIFKWPDFVNIKGVVVGWTVVRDLCNMFFVVILLVIAIATILRIESYNYKRFLPKLIIMAVLINFSKMIAGVIIDFFQILLTTFVDAFGGVLQGNIVHALGLQYLLNINPDELPKPEEGIDMWGVFFALVAVIIALVVTFVVILVMTVILAFRIVMLWLLVVLSPLAYLLAAFPRGESYAKQWWDLFIKWVTVGPLIAFFLWLALYILSDSAVSLVKATNPGGGATDFHALASSFGTGDFLQGFIIAIALLVAGMVLASQIGGAAGAFAAGAVGRLKRIGLAGTVGAAGVGLRAVGRRWDRGWAKLSQRPGFRGAGFLSPTVIKEAWKGTRAEAEREAFPLATGKMQDYINKKLRRKETTHERTVFNAQVAERQRDLVGLSAEENARMFDEAMSEGRLLEAFAMGKILTINNQWDDYTKYMYNTYKDKPGFEKFVHSPKNLPKHLDERFTDQFNKKRSGEFAQIIDELSEETGKLRMLGVSTLEADPRTGKMVPRWATDNERVKNFGIRLDRLGNRRIVTALEGKVAAVWDPEEQDYYSYRTGGFEKSHFAGYDDLGMKLASIIPELLSKTISGRPHETAFRIGETIGSKKMEDVETGAIVEDINPKMFVQHYLANSKEKVEAILDRIAEELGTDYVKYLERVLQDVTALNPDIERPDFSKSNYKNLARVASKEFKPDDEFERKVKETKDWLKAEGIYNEEYVKTHTYLPRKRVTVAETAGPTTDEIEIENEALDKRIEEVKTRKAEIAAKEGIGSDKYKEADKELKILQNTQKLVEPAVELSQQSEQLREQAKQAEAKGKTGPIEGTQTILSNMENTLKDILDALEGMTEVQETFPNLGKELKKIKSTTTDKKSRGSTAREALEHILVLNRINRNIINLSKGKKRGEEGEKTT